MQHISTTDDVLLHVVSTQTDHNISNILMHSSASDQHVINTKSISEMRKLLSWWRHQMETFSVQLAICAVNSREFPSQRPVKRSFDVSFDLRLNKRLRKQSWGWRFETLLLPLWRHCNVYWLAVPIPHMVFFWLINTSSTQKLWHHVPISQMFCEIVVQILYKKNEKKREKKKSLLEK